MVESRIKPENISEKYELRVNKLVNKLQENYQIKASEFIEHDAGNLMNVITGYGDRIKHDLGDKEENIEKVRSAEERIESLVQKGEKILESGEQRVNVGEELESAREMLEPLMQENGTEVEIKAEGNYPVNTRPVVERIFYDMMDNASEHGSTDTTVEVYSGESYIGVKFDQEVDAESIYEPGEGLNGSTIVGETAEGLDIDIVNLEDGYEIRIPRHLHEDNQA